MQKLWETQKGVAERLEGLLQKVDIKTKDANVRINAMQTTITAEIHELHQKAWNPKANLEKRVRPAKKCLENRPGWTGLGHDNI